MSSSMIDRVNLRMRPESEKRRDKQPGKYVLFQMFLIAVRAIEETGQQYSCFAQLYRFRCVQSCLVVERLVDPAALLP